MDGVSVPLWLVALAWLAILIVIGRSRGAVRGGTGVVRVVAAVGLVLVGFFVALIGFVLDGGLCFDYWASCEEPDDGALGAILLYGGLLVSLVAPAVVLLARGGARSGPPDIGPPSG